MTNENNEYRITELEKSLKTLESIANNNGLEEVEKVMSQYRIFAYAKEDFDKDVMKITEKAYEKYISKKTIENNKKIAESIIFKPDRHFFDRSLEGAISIVFGIGTLAILTAGYKVFDMIHEDLIKGDYKYAAFKTGGLAVLGLSAIATSLFSYGVGRDAIKDIGARGDMT